MLIRKDTFLIKEQDLESITAPSGKAKERLLSYLHEEWEFVPHVSIYP